MSFFDVPIISRMFATYEADMKSRRDSRPFEVASSKECMIPAPVAYALRGVGIISTTGERITRWLADRPEGSFIVFPHYTPHLGEQLGQYVYRKIDGEFQPWGYYTV